MAEREVHPGADVVRLKGCYSRGIVSAGHLQNIFGGGCSRILFFYVAASHHHYYHAPAAYGRLFRPCQLYRLARSVFHEHDALPSRTKDEGRMGASVFRLSSFVTKIVLLSNAKARKRRDATAALLSPLRLCAFALRCERYWYEHQRWRQAPCAPAIGSAAHGHARAPGPSATP